MGYLKVNSGGYGKNFLPPFQKILFFVVLCLFLLYHIRMLPSGLVQFNGFLRDPGLEQQFLRPRTEGLIPEACVTGNFIPDQTRDSAVLQTLY